MVGKGDEAVTEATGDHQLLFVFLAELHCHPLLIGGAVGAQVYGYVQHRASCAAHQLRLCHVTSLEVDPAESAFHGRGGMVVLYEIVKQARFLKLFLGPAFHKEAAVVAEHTGFHDHNAFQLCLCYFHL